MLSFLAPCASGSDYDPVKGRHLIIFPLKLIIEFLPGSTISLPSATMPHGNTPIATGEVHTSITQYCAGGLLRWVAYGFQSVKSLSSTALLDKGGPGYEGENQWASRFKVGASSWFVFKGK